MGLPVTQPRYTVSEYLQREEDSLEKHEYRDGQIILMAGGTPDHSLIIANVIRELGNRLKGKPCHVYDGNLRIRIPRSVLYTYPEASVICGPREVDPNDTTGRSVMNPRLIVEVLSPSTEGYDRGEKFDLYRRLASLEEYVLVTQVTPRIESFFRQPDGTWLFAPYSGLQSIAKLRSLDIEFPLSEAYVGVAFPAVQEGQITPLLS